MWSDQAGGAGNGVDKTYSVEVVSLSALEEMDWLRRKDSVGRILFPGMEECYEFGNNAQAGANGKTIRVVRLAAPEVNCYRCCLQQDFSTLKADLGVAAGEEQTECQSNAVRKRRRVLAAPESRSQRSGSGDDGEESDEEPFHDTPLMSPAFQPNIQ